jgi:hypothetical protein
VEVLEPAMSSETRVSVKRPRRSAVAMVKSVAASRRWLHPSRIGQGWNGGVAAVVVHLVQ